MHHNIASPPKALAEAFYRTFGEKNMTAISKYLHPDVQLISPLSTLKGKEAYLDVAGNFAGFFNTFTLRTVFGEGDEAVVVYDVECRPPLENHRQLRF